MFVTECVSLVNQGLLQERLGFFVPPQFLERGAQYQGAIQQHKDPGMKKRRLSEERRRLVQ